MKCPHERQEWKGEPLPCAEPGCPEGVPGRSLVLPYCASGSPLLREATFDRAIFSTGIAEVAGRALKKRCEARSVVWIRRGSPFSPRRAE